MAKKQTEILDLTSLEKARTEEEKSNSVGERPRTSLCLEQNENGRMDSSSKSNTWHNHYNRAVEKEGLY
jgi:hypothetical protein